MSEALNIDELINEVSLGLKVTEEDDYALLVREEMPLEKSDLENLELSGPSRSQSGLQHIRAYHHVIALKLAAGEKAVHISGALGVGEQTICKLQKDSQFQALIESYRGKIVEKTIDHFEIMSLVAGESLTALHEKLVSDEREEIPLESLRRIAETFTDRIGHSPVRRTENFSRHSFEVGSETLARVKQLHSEDSSYNPEVIEATVVSHQEETKSVGAAVSISEAFKPVAERTAQGAESSGEGV